MTDAKQAGMPALRLGSVVLMLHDDDWFDQGTVTGIDDGRARVDFADWIQSWPLNELVPANLLFHPDAWVPLGPGSLMADFR